MEGTSLRSKTKRKSGASGSSTTLDVIATNRSGIAIHVSPSEGAQKAIDHSFAFMAKTAFCCDIVR